MADPDLTEPEPGDDAETRAVKRMLRARRESTRIQTRGLYIALGCLFGAVAVPALAGATVATGVVTLTLAVASIGSAVWGNAQGNRILAAANHPLPGTPSDGNDPTANDPTGRDQGRDQTSEATQQNAVQARKPPVQTNGNTIRTNRSQGPRAKSNTTSKPECELTQAATNLVARGANGEYSQTTPTTTAETATKTQSNQTGHER